MTAISLPPICDRAAATTVHAELSDALCADPVAVDASQVTKMGQAVLQVLVSASATEGGIQLESPSDAMREIVALVGLEETLLKGAE